jgi:hypothetical protein
MIIKQIHKTISFLFWVFIFTDIGILINYILEDNMQRNIININKTALIFGSLTLLLGTIRHLLRKQFFS